MSRDKMPSMFHGLMQLKQKLSLRTRWSRFRRISALAGARAAFEYCWNSDFCREGEFQMHAPGVRHPLTLRAGTSDLDVFHQIFIQKEYADLDAMDNVQLVIDCGAYIGCSAVYFLSRFPQCHLIAVEPNSENFNLLNRNLAPYADRVTLIHAGVWSHTTRLKMSSDVYRDGLHWSGQVCPCADGDPDGFQAVDLTSLLRDSGQERISILKMDIEGAESLVFSKGDRSWIDKVDAIAIELHEDSSFGPASPIFFEAIKTQNFMVSTRGELTICRRKVGQ